MGKKFICLFSLLSLCVLSVFAVDPHADSISSYLKRGDTASVYKEFAQWQKDDPDSPNIADTWAWYYLGVGYTQNFRMDSVAPSGVEDYMQLMGENGKSEYIYMDVKVLCDSIKKGFQIIDKEISKHPDCMNLYLTKGEILMYLAGKCSHQSIEQDNVDFHHEKGDMTEKQRLNYLMSKALAHPVFEGDMSVVVGLPDSVVMCYGKMLDRSLVNANQWYDLYNRKVENGEADMLENLQSVVLALMQNADYESAGKLNDKVLTVYPKRFDFRNNKAMLMMLKRDFSGALSQFEVLHKDFPKDDIISFNLAETYCHLDNFKSAKKLFKSLTKSSNKNVAKASESRLEDLNKIGKK